MTDLASFVPKKALFCQLRQIGDVLLATPAAAALKARFPDCAVHFLTEKKCAPVLEGNPDIDRVHAIDKKEHANVLKALAFYRALGREGFDLAVDLQQLPRTKWAALFSRAKVRLTFTPPWYNRFIYTHWLAPWDGYPALAKTSLLRDMGVTWDWRPPVMALSGSETAWAGSYAAGLGLAEADTLVTVDPSHRRATRRWPAERFAELMDLALAERPDLFFVVLWGPGELDVAKSVRGAMSRPERCVVDETMLGLREMAALISLAEAHLGNCSAPRHMAAALGTPTLVPLGATSWAWTYPGGGHAHVSLGLDCQPCNENECARGDIACLRGLEPERMLPEFMKMLDTTEIV